MSSLFIAVLTATQIIFSPGLQFHCRWINNNAAHEAMACGISRSVVEDSMRLSKCKITIDYFNCAESMVCNNTGKSCFYRPGKDPTEWHE